MTNAPVSIQSTNRVLSIQASGSLTELVHISGVYTITCAKNGRVYVGQSKKIQQRLFEHIDDLSTGRHVNVELQQDFANYGINAFIYSIVAEFQGDQSDLRQREGQEVVSLLRQGIHLYNILDIREHMRQHPEAYVVMGSGRIASKLRAKSQ